MNSHCFFHKTLTVPQIKLVSILLSSVFEIQFDSMLPVVHRYLAFMLMDFDIICISHFSHAHCMPSA